MSPLVEKSVSTIEKTWKSELKSEILSIFLHGYGYCNYDFLKQNFDSCQLKNLNNQKCGTFPQFLYGNHYTLPFYECK